NPMEPIFTFKKGDTVEITLKNETGPEHPFHLHGQFFEIVDDGRYFTSQPGLKDTVLVPGNTELKIRAYFDNPGHWMAHCHILEHAALGMMSEILVLP
ncbi:MAG: multicopper oxidase domain-containing protein, partial [Myxococcota bacterium]|nr:multicopper oxidase domain-containing protein [Myxococcota bacterium]